MASARGATGTATAASCASKRCLSASAAFRAASDSERALASSSICPFACADPRVSPLKELNPRKCAIVLKGLKVPLGRERVKLYFKDCRHYGIVVGCCLRHDCW